VEAAASAKAAVGRGETNLQLARERRRDVIIRAPGDGTVLTRDVQPGQIIASAMANVSGGTTLFKTADLAEMQVRAKVDETDIGQVQPGQAVQVSVEAYPGRTFMGTVHKIEPQAVVEQNVTMFPVLVRLKNPERLLKPGMTAEVKIQVARRPDVTAVPNTAVVSPREARTAALAVGLDEDAVRAMFRAQADGNASPACVALREKLAAAGGPRGLSDEDREALRACRAASEAASGKPEGRRAVVFVQGANGPEPRRVRLGVSDWEYSEVLEGVSAGEQVVLVSVAQLQKKQQEMTDRFRQRTGGMVPGGGGGGGPRGR
ncbi:MAG: efflux RND transporter periplasmic adaptor subunit, partial [Myxococcales bacterium]